MISHPRTLSRRQVGVAVLSVALVAAACDRSDAAKFIDLGGPASGFLALSNLNNSSSQSGILSDLPDYPHFVIPDGFVNAGVWSAIIASPQSGASDYSAIFDAFYPGVSPIPIGNQTVTQDDFDTLSAGRIDFDNSLMTGVGAEQVGVGDLAFDFNTFLWDTEADANPFNDGLLAVSPFSMAYTPYNNTATGGSSSFGEAQFIITISIDNLSGDGLVFDDGTLVSADVIGDLSISVDFLAGAGLVLEYEGTLRLSGLDYSFAAAGAASNFAVNSANLFMNRAGALTLIPEPASAATASVGLTVLPWRQRFRHA